MLNNPSLANCDFLNIGEQIDELIEGGARLCHIDIMDGHYVTNLCYPVSFVKTVKDHYNIEVDVHLMVTNPQDYIDLLAKYKADYVSFHIDSTNFSRRLITSIKDLGMKAGVVINPSQPVELIEPIIGLLNYVVLMTVEPGFAAQRFLDGSYERLAKLSALRESKNCDFLISIDGGVTYESAKECARLGADIFVTNIYTVFNQPEGITKAYKRFTKELTSVLQSRQKGV